MPDGYRWWKNGDHPEDNSYRTLTEGAVVRRFRDPNIPGTDLCSTCGSAYSVHGWIDQGPDGLTVHPGDFVAGSPGNYQVSRINPLGDALAP